MMFDRCCKNSVVQFCLLYDAQGNFFYKDAHCRACSHAVEGVGNVDPEDRPALSDIEQAALLGFKHSIVLSGVKREHVDIVKFFKAPRLYRCIVDLQAAGGDVSIRFSPQSKPLSLPMSSFRGVICSLCHFVVSYLESSGPPADLDPFSMAASKHLGWESSPLLDFYPLFSPNFEATVSDPRLFIFSPVLGPLMEKHPTTKALFCEGVPVEGVCKAMNCEHEAEVNGVCRNHYFERGASTIVPLVCPVRGVICAKSGPFPKVAECLLCGPVVVLSASASCTSCSHQKGGSWITNVADVVFSAAFERAMRPVVEVPLGGRVTVKDFLQAPCEGKEDGPGCPEDLEVMRELARLLGIEFPDSPICLKEELEKCFGRGLPSFEVLVTVHMPTGDEFEYSLGSLRGPSVVSTFSQLRSRWVRLLLSRCSGMVPPRGVVCWRRFCASVRRFVIEMGAAGPLSVSRSTLLSEEHKRSSLCCFVISHIGCRLLRSPPALCFEDVSVRTAELIEMLTYCKDACTRRISGPDRGCVTQLIPHGTLCALVDSAVASASTQLSPMSVSQSAAAYTGVRESLERNRRMAEGFVESVDCGRLASVAAGLCKDIGALRTFCPRLAALMLARLLRKQEIDGLRPGSRSALGDIREALERIGWIKLAMKGVEGVDEKEGDDAEGLGDAVFKSLEEFVGMRLVLPHRPPASSSFSPVSPVSLLSTFFSLPASYVPQALGLADEEAFFPGIRALRNPFDLGHDLVNIQKASMYGLESSWTLSEEGTHPFGGATGLYWKRLSRPVPEEQVRDIRGMLLTKGLDHRCYSPFGPEFSAACGSFLIRVIGSVLSENDYHLKNALTKDFRANMTLEDKPPVSLQSPLAVETFDSLCLVPAGGSVLLEASPFRSSVFGRRIALEELSRTTEFCVLNFYDCDVDLLKGFLRDDPGLDVLDYTVPGVMASADYCRAWAGVSVCHTSQPEHFTACDVSFPPGSICSMLEECGRRVDEGMEFCLRMETYWNREGREHPNIALNFPLLHALGRPGGGPWGVMCSGIDVHSPSGDLLSLKEDETIIGEVLYFVRSICLGEDSITPVDALFMLEAGAFRAPTKPPSQKCRERFLFLCGALQSKFWVRVESRSRPSEEVLPEACVRILVSLRHMLPTLEELLSLAEFYVSVPFSDISLLQP